MGEHAGLTGAFERRPGLDLSAASGWCPPSEAYLDLFDPVGLRHWPPGLTKDDLDWLAEMLHAAELDPDPIVVRMELPTISVVRGGIRFPFPMKGEPPPTDEERAWIKMGPR